MSLKESKLQDILKSRGISMEQVDEELGSDIPEEKESSKKLMETYYRLKVTTDMKLVSNTIFDLLKYFLYSRVCSRVKRSVAYLIKFLLKQG